MSVIDRFYGLNAGYVLELYERYLQDPTSVDPAARAFFEHWRPEEPSDGQRAVPVPGQAVAVNITAIVAAANLAQSIRKHGHLAATLDPLGSPPPGDPALEPAAHGITEADLAALPAFIVGGPVAQNARSAAEAIAALRTVYCGTIGYDFDHVQAAEERAWLTDAAESGRYQQPLTAEQQRALLDRLTHVETFERFLHRTFVGTKRFSIEGTDMMVPMLDAVVSDAAATGIGNVMIGMAHRGRLNVLTHVLGKPYEQMIAEFMGIREVEEAEHETSAGWWTGDVKYHLGWQQPDQQQQVHITVPSNPSHLEFVNPVLEGRVRAAQESRTEPGAPAKNVDRVLPILINGDAAFPGEGVVAETVNISRRPAYQTGGTLHIIVNNQLGYTTEPWQGRSTYYASDVARGFEIPVIHVNADDPIACLVAARIAFAYRQRFHKDFLIDLIGYRRWGHNEGDEPSFTQPLMYADITAHPTVREIFARRLEQDGIVTHDEAEAMVSSLMSQLQEIRKRLADTRATYRAEALLASRGTVRSVETAVPPDTLRELNRQIHALPDGFTMNPKLKRNMQRRLEAIDKGAPIDWAHAEALAFAAILADGRPIRLTGQDTERGTFSQRHVVFHDAKTGETAGPLATMPLARASFVVANSPLSEAGALGFEYGYSVQAPEALVLWEAQFGDFANAAQVIIDQFIVAGRAKWRETSSLVLLLPHGYEGQGPEHSSARLERYLQLAANDNIRVVNPTTAAQYFHLLRHQAALLDEAPRPLVIMTPKSLLRHPQAASAAAELAHGRFPAVFDDAAAASRREAVGRLILCSGKVFVDLVTSDRRAEAENVAIARVEQLYPLPEDEILTVVANYPNVREVIWLQEEPENMGAWRFVAHHLRDPLAARGLRLGYIGREERASPAEGIGEIHALEQARIVEQAFAGAPVPEVKTYGVQHAD